MAPTPQEPAIPEKMVNGERARPATGEEVVITGMSGIFPNSDSTEQFMENLFNQVNMVDDKNPRWVFNHPEVSDYLGKVQGMGKFDAQFFRVHYKQACTMEPMSRKLLEHTYSAIFDAGYNSVQLRGKKIGVFIGISSTESDGLLLYENVQKNGFGITGGSKAMCANRISYWIDGKGPSYALDLACASSMACLEQAYRSISTGECDAAVVGGCNLCLKPHMSLNLRRAGLVTLTGKTRSFDKHGDGYARADAVNVFFLQKAKDARRVYAEVHHAKSIFNLKREAAFTPKRDTKVIEDFLNAFYSEVDVSPNEVEYIEANGIGIPEADGNELDAIGNIFGKEKPVKVGSVKSNMGHGEAASGVCALTKVCFAYHKGEIPGNLHYETPQDHISSVREGRVQVLQKNSPFNRGFTAINCFSFSGADIHVLLKAHHKEKALEKYKSDIPYLVLASGRQEDCVNMILNPLKSQPIDPEQIRLLHGIHQTEIPGHMCRGYTIIEKSDENNTVCHVQNEDYYSGTIPPVWFVYSGMGSQWAGMGADLMKIPTFSAAIYKCHKILEPKGIDLIHVITEPDKKIFDNILNSFVGIAAVQIGLTDTLRELGIVPDHIIGHSVGELGCAYADGCFTAEEMILAAYSRGLVSVQTPFIRGSMAAIGLSFKAIQAIIPPEIEVACHNSSESATISGPADIMKTFVADLTSRGIFAKEVPCSNIAFHSRYIAEAGPGLLKYLTDVIKSPKERSKKWLSTSVPQDEWDEPQAKYSSAEYHTNNLLNSVLFEETSKLIPAGALMIEIAPHGLLQAILKKSHPECVHVPLTRRAHPNSVHFFLESIGKMYQKGLQPQIEILYPKVDFPVSTGTPMLSHMVGWEHSEDWAQAKYNCKTRIFMSAHEFVMSILDDDFKYMQGHVRNGNTVLPESALLVLVWETLAMYLGISYQDMSVVFRNVHFLGEATLKTEEPFRLSIMIDKGDKKFEVSHKGMAIATGIVFQAEPADIVTRDLDKPEHTKDEIVLTSEDVYITQHLKGYAYKGLFQSIHATNSNYNKASVKWSNNWVAFLDSLIQLNALSRNHEGISKPSFLRKLTINTEQHKKEIESVDVMLPLLKTERFDLHGISRCAGTEIDGIEFVDKPVSLNEPDVLATGSFVPHCLTKDVDVNTAVLLNLQVLADNIADSEIKITEIFNGPSPILSEVIEELSFKMPIANFTINSVRGSTVTFDQLDAVIKSNVLIVENLLADEKKLNNLFSAMQNNTFVLSMEDSMSKVNPKYNNFNVITALSVHGKFYVLLNKSDVHKNENIMCISTFQENKFSWISSIQNEITKTRRLVLVSETRSGSGLLGLVKRLSKDYPGKIALVLIDDFDTVSFNPKSNIYKEQLQKNLTINILRNGKWGGFYYLPTSKTIRLQNAKLINESPGDIDRLTWVESSSVVSSKDAVQVHYTGPSFKDAQKAAGMVKAENVFGMDYSGINCRGQKVMGLSSGGTIASTVKADADLVWPVPEHWTMEDAATVPLPYVHALYLLLRHNILKGTSVFVTGGAGGLGQAVISICLANGHPVYTSVGDIHKKKFLLKLFPELSENHIACSRQENFYELILQSTSGKGCVVVINGLSGPFRQSAMKCCGQMAVFYDISDFDMRENKDFGMYFLVREKNYISMNINSIFRPENNIIRQKIQGIIAEGITAGWVKPTTRITYDPSDVIRAFRLLSSCKHMGRVLIKLVDTNKPNQKLTIKPRVTYSPEKTLVVVPGDSYLGIELIDLLVKKGARKFIINLKQNSLDGYLQLKLLSWKKVNVELRITSDSLQTKESCLNLLKKGIELGPVEGIFVVNSSKKASTTLKEEEFSARFEETALIVANLDQTSQKICNELRQFVVLSCSSGSYVDEYLSSVNQEIGQSRVKMGLPALIYHVNMLDEFNHEMQVLKMNVKEQKVTQILNALEISMKMDHSNIISFNLKNQNNKNFLKHISKILGVNNINDISDDLTIKDVGVNDVVIEELRTFLKEKTEENYSAAGVSCLTIAELKSLDPRMNKLENTKFDSGLGAFYTFIEEDECTAAEPMVAMPTRLSNATEVEEELDPKETYLMLIPGFEGHHQIFVPVCERLKLRALTCQLGPDMATESIQKMALEIMIFIKKRFELKSKFYLLGYSFGVNVALELAALIEKEGHVGVVFCLDSSPDALRAQLDAYLGDQSDAQLQNMIIEHMYQLMTGEDCQDIKQHWENLEKWSDKVAACLLKLRGVIHYSHQYKQSLLESAYERIKLARSYEPRMRLESEIILMKGMPHPKAKSLSHDYNLSLYTKQPVKVLNLESDHAVAPNDCRVSNIVNSFLEPRIVEDFKKMNLCESYLTNLNKMF